MEPSSRRPGTTGVQYCTVKRVLSTPSYAPLDQVAEGSKRRMERGWDGMVWDGQPTSGMGRDDVMRNVAVKPCDEIE